MKYQLNIILYKDVNNSFIHSFILYLPYIQNFTMRGWNNEIKEKVNGEET